MEDYLDQFNSRGAEARRDLLIQDYRKFEKIMEMDRRMTMERPEEQFGPLEEFVAGFITDEMGVVFSQAAEEFLHAEPMLQTKEGRKVLRKMHKPVRKDRTLRDPYYFPVLEMMALCALSGSAYSRELLIGLYKTYYKREYNVLKRFRTLSLADIEDFIGIEAQRRGLPVDEEHDPLEYDFSDHVMGRLVIMADLMNIELDQSWNGLIERSNDDVLRNHIVWKILECVAQDDSYLDAEVDQYLEQSDRLSSELPGVDWYFTNEEVDDPGDLNQLIALCKHVIERAMDDRLVNSAFFMEDPVFDLRDSAVNALVDIKDWFDPAQSADKVVLFAVIRYLADVIAALESRREEELQETVGFRYRELVTEEMLEEFEAGEEMIRTFREEQVQVPTDAKLSHLLSRAEEAGRRARPADSNIQKEENNRKDGSRTSGKTTTGRAVGASSGSEDPSGKDETIAELKRQLEEKSRQVEELRGKIREQRELQEESRRREISQRAHMDEWKRNQAELIALRNFAHDLETEDPYDETPADEDMKTFLAGRKIMVIGGHENWIKKMRRLFPDWEYITGNTGLGITGAVKSCDKIYFYTDICGHSLYYKFLTLAAENHKPYAFLHGTNPDRVIRYIYDDLTAGGKG